VKIKCGANKIYTESVLAMIRVDGAPADETFKDVKILEGEDVCTDP